MVLGLKLVHHNDAQVSYTIAKIPTKYALQWEMSAFLVQKLLTIPSVLLAFCNEQVEQLWISFFNLDYVLDYALLFNCSHLVMGLQITKIYGLNMNYLYAKFIKYWIRQIITFGLIYN